MYICTCMYVCVYSACICTYIYIKWIYKGIFNMCILFSNSLHFVYSWTQFNGHVLFSEFSSWYVSSLKNGRRWVSQKRKLSALKLLFNKCNMAVNQSQDSKLRRAKLFKPFNWSYVDNTVVKHITKKVRPEYYTAWIW